jgi:hypothetical protein
MAYRSLTKEEQARFDPMITGFNPADMYAADHIRECCRRSPACSPGSASSPFTRSSSPRRSLGRTASLTNPALDRILDFAGRDRPGRTNTQRYGHAVPEAGSAPAYLEQMKELVRRHPKTTIIWAHTGMGRIVRPVTGHAAIIEAMLKDPAFDRLYFDISWNEVAKYFVASPESTRIAANLIEGHPDRFLFGTDEVAPPNQKQYLRTYDQYAPMWTLLSADARGKVLKRNYERLFDEARVRVRAWEQAHSK